MRWVSSCKWYQIQIQISIFFQWGLLVEKLWEPPCCTSDLTLGTTIFYLIIERKHCSEYFLSVLLSRVAQQNSEIPCANQHPWGSGVLHWYGRIYTGQNKWWGWCKIFIEVHSLEAGGKTVFSVLFQLLIEMQIIDYPRLNNRTWLCGLWAS